MPPTIPPVLAGYIERALATPSLTLLTSVLETPTNWLVVRFLIATLYGVEESDLRRSRAQIENDIPENGTKIILLSIFRSFDLWMELTRKTGLDLTGLLKAGRLAYIDGLATHDFSIQQDSYIIRPKSLKLEDIKISLSSAVQSLTTDSSSTQKTVVILDGVDFLLASQPDLTALQVQQFLISLQESVSNVILTCSADASLIHNVDQSATPLEIEHGVFARLMAYQSNILMQLRPLETGYAKDVSGIIQIANRNSEQGEGETLQDGEWLYHLKGDGSVRIWSRGE